MLTSNDDFEYVNGTYFDPFGGGTATYYNGTLKTIDGPVVPLPSETITDQLDADANYTLFSAALTAIGAIGTDNYTVFAIDNATFTAAYTYTTVAEVDAADPTEFDDLMNHVATGFYFDIDIDDGVLPTLTAASANELVFTTTATGIGVLPNPMDITNVPELTATDVYFADNGVIHAIDGIISF